MLKVILGLVAWQAILVAIGAAGLLFFHVPMYLLSGDRVISQPEYEEAGTWGHPGAVRYAATGRSTKSRLSSTIGTEITILVGAVIVAALCFRILRDGESSTRHENGSS
jgi:hypothetical protein